MQLLNDIITDKDTVFVDVRTPQEFASGHVDAAINIPLDQLMHRLDAFKDFTGPIVLYCRSGNRSGMAQLLLQAQGFRNLYNGGGLDDLSHLLKQARVN